MEPLNLKGKQRAPDNDDDGFFMERLEMLYEQGLGDLRAFSEREKRPRQFSFPFDAHRAPYLQAFACRLRAQA